MTGKWYEALTGPLEEKRQYRQDKARIDALPEPQRSAARAMLRYLMYYGAVTAGDALTTMVTDLADLWERAAVDGTPVRDIVGEDPVDFAETFAQAYAGRQWLDKERARLTTEIDAATALEKGTDA